MRCEDAVRMRLWKDDDSDKDVGGGSAMPAAVANETTEEPEKEAANAWRCCGC